MSVEVKGLDTITGNIAKMLKNIEGASEKIVTAGAKPQYKDIKNTIFVGETGLAKKEITLGKPHIEQGKTVINIGWTGESKSGWRIHFVEWGTVRQKPQRKIEQSIERTHDAKINAMKQAMKKEYRI